MGSITIDLGDVTVLGLEWAGDGLNGLMTVEGPDGPILYRITAKIEPIYIEWTGLNANLPMLFDSYGRLIAWSHLESVREDVETTVRAMVDPGNYAIWSVKGPAASLTGISVKPDGRVILNTFRYEFTQGSLISHEALKAIEELPQPWVDTINAFVYL